MDWSVSQTSWLLPFLLTNITPKILSQFLLHRASVWAGRVQNIYSSPGWGNRKLLLKGSDRGSKKWRCFFRPLFQALIMHIIFLDSLCFLPSLMFPSPDTTTHTPTCTHACAHTHTHTFSCRESSTKVIIPGEKFGIQDPLHSRPLFRLLIFSLASTDNLASLKITHHGKGHPQGSSLKTHSVCGAIKYKEWNNLTALWCTYNDFPIAFYLVANCVQVLWIRKQKPDAILPWESYSASLGFHSVIWDGDITELLWRL